jgi:hypothetical protein
MNRKTEIEANLERSLRKQVTAPKLDGRFDAAVWSRIEAEEKRASVPVRRAAKPPRWLFISNVFGFAVIAALLVVFALRGMSGVELDIGVELPRVSAQTEAVATQIFGWAMTIVVLAYGVMRTSLGRRLRRVLT